MEGLPESRVASEAVDRILASAEAAIVAIRGRTEQQLRGIAAELEAGAAEEARRQRERLELLRVELTERAATIAGAYQAIGAQLAAVEAALKRDGAGAFAPREEPLPPAVAAVKMTLRERQRIDVAADVEPPPSISQHRSRRRRWLPWQREAA